MNWIMPQFSRSAVRRAGEILLSDNVLEYPQAYDVLNNWRASHSFPLNTIQVRLRRFTMIRDNESLIAQRLKRVPTILDKLKRFPGMSLERMQDIGGCRAIVQSIKTVYNIKDDFENSRIKHKKVNVKDYIKSPKSSGYRGIHLVYKYHSDKNSTYNGLLIEIQLRTKLQHAWATAVETVGTFIKYALKSSLGPEEWLHFFKLISSAFANMEKMPIVPSTPTDASELRIAIKHLEKKLDVRRRLNAYSSLVNAIEEINIDAYYIILLLKAKNNELQVFTFNKKELGIASNKYIEYEKKLSAETGDDVVLVAMDSIERLQEAYPNYFLDTKLFIQYLEEYLKSQD
jgi:ppGpp synthetase/RelA/SpoT-type nucleotidyltranferase